jgi:hypothetical protein
MHTALSGLEMERLRAFGRRCLVGAGLLGLCQTAAVCSELDEIVPVSESLCQEMILHHVMSSSAPVGCERLRLVRFAYLGFDEHLHQDGEIVVMDAVADFVLRCFAELRERRFPIAKARLMNEYDGNDDASTADDNSSAFNDRKVTGGGLPSLHSYGLAIDLNPVQNPYLTRSGSTLNVDPESGADYVNRIQERPGRTPRKGMTEDAIDIFANNGFLIWGGYWDDPIDYQHFDVGRPLADKLIQSTPDQARELFAQHVSRYLRCHSQKPGDAGRSACIAAENLMNSSPAD